MKLDLTANDLAKLADDVVMTAAHDWELASAERATIAWAVICVLEQWSRKQEKEEWDTLNNMMVMKPPTKWEDL